MPLIQVDMFTGRDREKKRNLANALTDAFVETCGGTPESVQIIIRDIEKEDWAVAGSLAVDRASSPSTPGAAVSKP